MSLNQQLSQYIAACFTGLWIQSHEHEDALVEIAQGKHNRTFVVILSPVVQIPTELEKQIVVLEHDLPGREQLEEIARGVATEDGELPTGDALATVLDASAGLTRFEAEGAFSLSLVREGRVTPDAVWQLKSQALKKSGLVSLHRGSETFDQLGGLDNLKAYVAQRSPKRRVRDRDLQRHQQAAARVCAG